MAVFGGHEVIIVDIAKKHQLLKTKYMYLLQKQLLLFEGHFICM